MLTVAIIVNILAFFFSSMPGPFYTAHEMLVVVPFSAALAARLIVPRLATPQTRLLVFGGLVMAVVLLGNAVLAPRTPEPVAELTAWLRQQHLTYGLAVYRQAASVTVVSHGEVSVRPVINDSAGHVGPWAVAVRTDWYDPRRNDARFVVADRSFDATGTVDDLNDTVLVMMFGQPIRTARLGDFEVWVYDYNLLERLLPADQLPSQYRYFRDR